MMQRTARSVVRALGPLHKASPTVPYQLCKRSISVSSPHLMPRITGRGGKGGKKGDQIFCPKCSSPISIMLKFSGTKRQIKCTVCDYCLAVESVYDPATDCVKTITSTSKTPLSEEVISLMAEGRFGMLYDKQPEEAKDEPPVLGPSPLPKDIFSYLDMYVTGQTRAKKVLSVALYNHYKRLHALTLPKDEGDDIPQLDKSNVLLIGPTGTGKTYLFQMVAQYLDVPLVVCDCTSLTQAGYVGEDVESAIVRLWHASGHSIERCQQGLVVLDEIDKLACKRNKHGGKDIGGEGVQQSLLKIIEGTIVTVNDNAKNKSVQIDTKNILFLSSGAFVGLERIIKKRTSTKSLGFGAPSDKAFKQVSPATEALAAAEVSDKTKPEQIVTKSRKDRLEQIKTREEKNKVRDDLLMKVEPRDVLDYGVIPELAGRIPVIVTLDTLTQDDLVEIACNKERGVVSQITDLLQMDDCELVFTNEAIKAVAELAFCKQIGARAIKSIVEASLLEAMYEVPGSTINKATVTESTVLDKTAPDYEYKQEEVTDEA